MKYFALLTLVCLFQNINAQTCGINYAYDASGNRIQRSQCYGSGYVVIEDLPNLDFQDISILQVMNEVRIDDTISNSKNFIIFPNPSTGVFYIDYGDILINPELIIIDLKGSIVYNDLFRFTEIDISHFNDGIYFVILKDVSSIKTGKIIKTSY